MRLRVRKEGRSFFLSLFLGGFAFEWEKRTTTFLYGGVGSDAPESPPSPRGTANLWSSSTQKRENFFSPLFLVSLFGKKRRSGQLRKVLWFLLPFPLGNEEEEEEEKLLPAS